VVAKAGHREAAQAKPEKGDTAPVRMGAHKFYNIMIKAITEYAEN